MKADGAAAEGKAIWVIKGNNTRVANIEFSGAKVRDKNGAGIRQEGINLTVMGCYFHDNENGILAGRNVEGLEHERKLPATFFRDLRALVEEVHKRGLAHCDLKRAPNTIIGPDGKPYIVDWSAAIAHREFRFFPLTLIYRRFIQDDFNAVIKLQLRHCPEAIDPVQKKRYYHRGPIERAIRSIRDRARDILQKIA